MDERWMKEALMLAKKAADIGEIPIGAVVVKNENIIGRGYNTRESQKNALHHAEINAIDDACKNIGGWRLSGCDLYVTLEPCVMCAGACINARIDNVFFGAKDEKGGGTGSLINVFHLPLNHHPRVVGGVMKDECEKMLTDFFIKIRKEKTQP